jgi:hypothetical protein
MNNTPPDKNSDAYKAKLALSIKAFEKGCFIHSKDTGKLYTPREFLESDEKIKIETYAQQDYSNMTLHYVDYLMKSKLAELRKAQQDYDEFMQKVVEGFSLTPRPALKKKK